MTNINVKVSVVIDGVEYVPPFPGNEPKLIFERIGPFSEQKLPDPEPGEPTMIQLTDTQQVEVSIAAVDKHGHPAEVDSVSFTSSDEAIATVTQDGTDKMKAMVVALAPGNCQIQVNADADMGEGTTNIGGVLDVTVVAGAAASLTVNTGTPTEQP